MYESKKQLRSDIQDLRKSWTIAERIANQREELLEIEKDKNKRLQSSKAEVKVNNLELDLKNKKLKSEINRLESDFLKEAELREFMRSIATIPYALKFFDTLVYNTILAKALIASNQTTALDHRQGQIIQLKKFRTEVETILKKPEDND